MSSVKNIRFAAFSIPTLIAFAVVCALAMSPPDDDKAKEQDEIRTVAQKTLQQLYKAQPAAQSALEHAAGYAVFSNMGIKILFAGSGKGKGIAVDNQTKKEIFMKMVELQAGLGMGAKKFSVVFIFDDDKALSGFVNTGGDFGGQATAAAKSGDKGGSLAGATSVADGGLDVSNDR